MTLWYQAFPCLCVVGGIVAHVLSAGTGLLKISGVLLIAAAIPIVRRRWVRRRRRYEWTPAAAQAMSARFADD